MIEMNFDPLAWANMNNANVNEELAKARTVADELISRGANIAESYDDYLHLGFALANGLGSAGRDIYHELCAQSSKYREADCENKWQECLSKNDGRTTIATFYKMAQQSGVDLRAVSSKFPSFPSNPHGSAENVCGSEKEGENGIQLTNNKIVRIDNNRISASSDTFCKSREGLREMRGIQSLAGGCNEDERFNYNESFSDKLNASDFPALLRDVNNTQNDGESRDKVDLAALTLWSGCMPNVSGIYKKKRVAPPIFGLINAPSGAQKGAVEDCRQLVMPIEMELRREHEQQQAEFEQRHAEWSALEHKQRRLVHEPKEPQIRSMIISANSSASIIYDDLENNGGAGIIFDTEADTLTNVLNQEWGQWSDLLRKAFHHEQVSLRRKNDNTRIVIDRPRLAVLLTCTPGQIPLLLPADQVENGLANRFLFYCLRGSKGWEDPFENEGMPLDEMMLDVGQRYLKLYHALQQRAERPLEFTFSEEQKGRFNDFFRPLYNEQIGMNGKDLEAFIFRLGLSTFRIAMILTVLRCADIEPMFEAESQVLVCGDNDFHTALTIANTLINHTCHVYANILPHAKPKLVVDGVKMTDRQRQFLMELAPDFDTDFWKNCAKEMNIPFKTAERYMGEFINKLHVVERISNGHFRLIS